jgi:hypothetical protein
VEGKVLGFKLRALLLLDSTHYFCEHLKMSIISQKIKKQLTLRLSPQHHPLVSAVSTLHSLILQSSKVLSPEESGGEKYF